MSYPGLVHLARSFSTYVFKYVFSQLLNHNLDVSYDSYSLKYCHGLWADNRYRWSAKDEYLASLWFLAFLVVILEPGMMWWDFHLEKTKYHIVKFDSSNLPHYSVSSTAVPSIETYGFNLRRQPNNGILRIIQF